MDDITDEDSLFVDPAVDIPEDHISFHAEFAFSLDDSAKGEASIEGLGLNRQDLVEERFTYLEYIRTLVDILDMVQVSPDKADKAQTKLNNALQDNAKYSSMTRSFVSG